MHTYRGKPGFNRFVADSPVFADVADIDTVLLDGAIGLDSDELVAIEGLAGCGEGGCWDAWQLDRFVVAPALQGLLDCGGHGADRGAVLEPVVRERVLDREELEAIKWKERLRKGRLRATAWYREWFGLCYSAAAAQVDRDEQIRGRRENWVQASRLRGEG